MGTFLPDRTGVVVEQYGNAEFSRDVIATFDGLRDELTDNENLLHPQMGTLGAAVREALEAGGLELPLQICEFLARALEYPNAVSELENAVAISFVEASELRATKMGRVLLERMPHRVRSILLEQEKRGGAQ